jgi:hypothetical protein
LEGDNHFRKYPVITGISQNDYHRFSQQKSPEPVPDSGLEAQRSVLRRATRSVVEQSQNLGCAGSGGSDGLTMANEVWFLHSENYIT